MQDKQDRKKSFELYQWQKEAIKQLSGKNAVLSAPTGAGKTAVCKGWADIDNPNQSVIFTAPIKALSNERYSELLDEGYDVGIDTGDFKENTNARIICCTQEIYTNKYAQYNNLNVIIDEFHYIAQNPERTRAYIDGIVKSQENTRILVLSATFGNTKQLRDYLSKLKKQPFELYQTSKRATSLEYVEEPAKYEEIQNALVFTFSKNNCYNIASKIMFERLSLPKEAQNKIDEIFSVLEIEDEDLRDFAYSGIGIYCGSMLPKEKLAIEMLTRSRVLDTVVGTDALALGVNLPAETVIFSQLGKYYDGPLSVAEFRQMSGRAGRKGYFEHGYVQLLKDNSFESSDIFNRKNLYHYLTVAPVNNMYIDLQIDYQKIIDAIPRIDLTTETSSLSLEDNSKDKTKYYIPKVPPLGKQINKEKHLKEEFAQFMKETGCSDSLYDNFCEKLMGFYKNVIEEIQYVIDNSFNIKMNERTVESKIYEIYEVLATIQETINEINEDRHRTASDIEDVTKDIVDTIKLSYFREYDISKNIYLASMLVEKQLTEQILYNAAESFQDLLQAKRYINHLPKAFRKTINGKGFLDKQINELDISSNNFIQSKQNLTNILAGKEEAKKYPDIDELEFEEDVFSRIINPDNQKIQKEARTDFSEK